MVGMHTAHVVNADEFGPNTGKTSPKVPVDFAVRSLDELADAYRICKGQMVRLGILHYV
jgi:hypothetical protein